MSFFKKDNSENKSKYSGKFIRVKDKPEHVRTERSDSGYDDEPVYYDEPGYYDESGYYDEPAPYNEPEYAEEPEPKDQPEETYADVNYSRAVVFVLTRVILAVVVIVLVWMGFNIGLNSVNVYTLAKDAMTVRTAVALQPDKVEEGKVEKYFTANCIARDEILSGDKYSDYEISNYYDRIIVDASVIWPWQDEVEVTLVEQVMDITGTYSLEHLADLGKTEEEMEGVEVQIPEWQNGEYKLKYIREDDKWIVDEVTFVSEAPDRMMKEYDEDGELVSDTNSTSSSAGSVEITTVS